MRALAVLALLATACESWPEGRYLFVDGESSGIEFDRVELYFGKSVGDALPSGVPNYVAPIDGTEELLRRQQVGTEDGELLGGATTQVDLYLSPSDAMRVGEYVMVIAYLGDEPRGIGEVRHFGTDWADITRYQVVLEPFPTDTAVFDRWGPSDGTSKECVRWTRDKRTTAIVPDDDRDCDGFDDNGVDCDPLTYCGDATACASNVPCVSDADTCTLGACVNSRAEPRTCTPQVCLPAAACTSGCTDAGNSLEVLDCVLEDPSTHGEDLRIPVMPSQALCSVPYELYVQLPDGAVCIEGPIETSSIYQSDAPVPFSFYAIPDVLGCKVKMQPLTPDAIFEGTYHILIWLAAGTTNPTPRSVVVGMQPELTACETVTITIPPMYLEGCP